MTMIARWDIREESYSNGADVTILTDQVGSVDLAQLGAIDLPTYVSATDSVDFSGSQAIGNRSISAPLEAAAKSDNWTIAVLVNQATLSADWACGFADSSQSGISLAMRTDTGGQVSLRLNGALGSVTITSASTAMVPGVDTVLFMWRNGTNIGCSIEDNTAKTSTFASDFSTTDLPNFGLGLWDRSGPGFYWTGSQIEVRVYDTDESANRTAVVAEMKAGPVAATPVTLDTTFNAASTYTVVQTTIAAANTVDDESMFGSTWITVEDDMQVRFPTVVNGMTITPSAAGDGTWTVDVNQTETFQIDFFSPANSQWSSIDYTITAAATETPAAFVFTDITDAALSSGHTNTQALTGGTLVDGVTVLTVTNGLTSTTGPTGTFDSSAKTYSAGNSFVRATVTASGSYSTAVTQTPSVNGVSDEFSVTTLASVSPVMPADTAGNVAEPSQTFGTFAAGNVPDPAAVYTVTGIDSGVLSINSATGAVTADAPTDEGTKDTYTFTVTATNVAGNDSQNVVITIVEPSTAEGQPLLSLGFTLGF